jgi:hypothetical protein
MERSGAGLPGSAELGASAPEMGPREWEGGSSRGWGPSRTRKVECATAWRHCLKEGTEPRRGPGRRKGGKVPQRNGDCQVERPAQSTCCNHHTERAPWSTGGTGKNWNMRCVELAKVCDEGARWASLKRESGAELAAWTDGNTHGDS